MGKFMFCPSAYTLWLPVATSSPVTHPIRSSLLTDRTGCGLCGMRSSWGTPGSSSLWGALMSAGRKARGDQKWKEWLGLTRSPVSIDLSNPEYVRKPRKKPKGQGSDSFSVGGHMRVLEEWWPWRGHGSPMPCPIPGPIHIFHLSVPELYLFKLNQRPSKAHHLWVLWVAPAKWCKPMGMAFREALVYGQLVRSTGDNLDLWLAFEVRLGTGGVRFRTWPLTCGLCCHLQVECHYWVEFFIGGAGEMAPSPVIWPKDTNTESLHSFSCSRSSNPGACLTLVSHLTAYILWSPVKGSTATCDWSLYWTAPLRNISLGVGLLGCAVNPTSVS